MASPPPSSTRQSFLAAIDNILMRPNSKNGNNNNSNNNNDNNSSRKCCLFGWHPFTLFIVLTTSFVLSTMSSLDCQFVKVNGIYYDETTDVTADNIGVGLWSFEEWVSLPSDANKKRKKGVDNDSDNTNENNIGSKVKAAQGWYNEMIKDRTTTCVMYGKAYERGGLVFRTRNGDAVVSEAEKDVYKKWFTNGDVNWSISRLTAFGGFFFGLFANLGIWLMVCLGKSKLISKEHLLYAVICAFVFESIKVALFFNISFCRSLTNPTPTTTQLFDGGGGDGITTTTTMDKMGTERIVRSCGFGRGSASSLTATLLYLLALLLCLGYYVRPKKYGENDNDDDDMSVPKLFHTIRQRSQQKRRSSEESNDNGGSVSNSRRSSASNSRRSSNETNPDTTRRQSIETNNTMRIESTRPPPSPSCYTPSKHYHDDYNEERRKRHGGFDASSVVAQNCVDIDERGLGARRKSNRGKYVSRYVNIGAEGLGGRSGGRRGGNDHHTIDLSTLTGNS